MLNEGEGANTREGLHEAQQAQIISRTASRSSRAVADEQSHLGMLANLRVSNRAEQTRGTEACTHQRVAAVGSGCCCWSAGAALPATGSGSMLGSWELLGHSTASTTCTQLMLPHTWKLATMVVALPSRPCTATCNVASSAQSWPATM